ncbi:MAG: arsenite efflux transporter metallochaperone ArsD [Bacteroidetes bacterium]|jgi:hypothetical protein|nr:arsenite efflux transporter metallochaperone ArsD [Bacteroidota bacterium]
MTQEIETKRKEKIDVYDPAMCCSTGVCGADVDDELANFANDVKWLKSQGVEVQRFNLGQEPEAFKRNEQVLHLLKNEGSDCLPIIFFNGEVVSEGKYLSRSELSNLLSFDDDSLNKMTETKINQLLDDLRDVTVNGDEEAMCNQFQSGKDLGIQVEQLVTAIQNGINKRQLTTQNMVQAANELLGVSQNRCGCSSESGCC